MTIRSRFGFALILSSLIGLLGLGFLTFRYFSLNQERISHREHASIIRSIDRLELLLRQWLSTADLIIASDNTFLAESVAEQSDAIYSLIAGVKDNPLSKNSQTSWEDITTSIQAIQAMIKEFATLDARSISARSSQFLEHYDNTSIRVVELFASASQSVHEAVESRMHAIDDELAAVYHEMLLIAVAYLLSMWLIWKVTCRSVLNPLDNLIEAAERSRKENAPFRFDQAGPEEVNVMASGFRRLVDTLQQEQARLTESMDELETAKQKIDAAYKAKSDFLSQMSHEFRTPLNAILGYSEMVIEELQQLEVPEHLPQDVLRVNHSGKHLLTLINDILDFSKLEQGKFQLFPRDVPLAEEAQLIADTVDILIEKNENQLVSRFPEQHVTAVIDPLRWRQIILNFLSNSAKFTENGKIELEVTFHQDMDGTSWVFTSVSDTGIGMTEEEIHKVFEPFTQASAETSVTYGGTGLGLSICVALLDAMGGQLFVSSEKGVGSRFTIIIPEDSQSATKPRPSEKLIRLATKGTPNFYQYQF